MQCSAAARYQAPVIIMTCRSSRRLNSSFSRSRRRCCRPFKGHQMAVCQNQCYPCSSHQNSWVKMDVNPTKNGIFIGIDPYPNVLVNHIILPFLLGDGCKQIKQMCVLLDTWVWTGYNLIVSPILKTTYLDNNKNTNKQKGWTGNSDGNTPSVQNSGSAMCVRFHFSDFRWRQKYLGTAPF